jgi:hypothetical protein
MAAIAALGAQRRLGLGGEGRERGGEQAGQKGAQQGAMKQGAQG